MEKAYDVFLSYSHEEQEWVNNLVNALSERGIRVWYDQAEIKPGDEWVERIQEGLRSSSHIVFIITSKGAQSNWAALELGAALGLNKSIIPVVAPGLPAEAIPGPVRLRRYVQKTDPVQVADEIARGIAGELDAQRTPA